jgi:hypothetical protein
LVRAILFIIRASSATPTDRARGTRADHGFP